jgi:hypothetical protein
MDDLLNNHEKLKASKQEVIRLIEKMSAPSPVRSKEQETIVD